MSVKNFVQNKYLIKIKYNSRLFIRTIEINTLDDTILNELTNYIKEYINYPQLISLDIINSLENINIYPFNR